MHAMSLWAFFCAVGLAEINHQEIYLLCSYVQC